MRLLAPDKATGFQLDNLINSPPVLQRIDAIATYIIPLYLFLSAALLSKLLTSANLLNLLFYGLLYHNIILYRTEIVLCLIFYNLALKILGKLLDKVR